ncbi:MAG: SH3 domain-containing protein [Phyllobacteriaceae bacterium]|nr:SH3 domain-containing protein [Phyllobacteriaceae bacterium]
MRRSVAVLFGLGLGLAATGPARAGCDVRAWSKDRDPAGLNVRAAPGTGAAVVARLPPPRREGEETIAVEVHVVGSRDGWLEIDRAEFSGYDLPAKTVFGGRGWVSGRLIDVSVQDERVRAKPTTAAEVLDAPRERPLGGREILRLDRVLACEGRWFEIEGRFTDDAGAEARATRGWVTGLCGNQVTTCP